MLERKDRTGTADEQNRRERETAQVRRKSRRGGSERRREESRGERKGERRGIRVASCVLKVGAKAVGLVWRAMTTQRLAVFL